MVGPRSVACQAAGTRWHAVRANVVCTDEGWTPTTHTSYASSATCPRHLATVANHRTLGCATADQQQALQEGSAP